MNGKRLLKQFERSNYVKAINMLAYLSRIRACAVGSCIARYAGHCRRGSLHRSRGTDEYTNQVLNSHCTPLRADVVRERALRLPARDAVGIIELGFGGWTAVAGITGLARAGNGDDEPAAGWSARWCGLDRKSAGEPPAINQI